ncbi:hypothetical protein KBI33_01455 [Candidatus Shapirobacteria bacterium]|nr:hypothetical protein [Candidatus Shapirobacteria bacterium]
MDVKFTRDHKALSRKQIIRPDHHRISDPRLPAGTLDINSRLGPPSR